MGFVFWALLLGLLACIYLLVRNAWVYRRRRELIDWHYSRRGYYRNFDNTYGTYADWMYGKWYCWDAAKIAGLPKWIK